MMAGRRHELPCAARGALCCSAATVSCDAQQISKQVRRLDGVRQVQEDMYEASGPRAMSPVSAVVASVNAVQ